MRVKLTKRIVDGAVSEDPKLAVSQNRKARDVVVWDSEVPGFGLKVTPSGQKSYFVYYRTSSGQQRRPKIGNHGALTVDEARAIARQWMAAAASGLDVSATRKADRKAGTVSDLAKRYLEDYAEAHKKLRSVATDRANLENHVIPQIGTMSVRDVTRQDIDRLKVAIKDGKTARQLPAKPRGRRVVRGGEGIANRVVALVSKMFACAVEWGIRDTNPAANVRKFREKRKERFLDAAEVGRLLAALDSIDAEQALSLKATVAIRVLLFTGMRYGEVMNLRWSNVDTQHQCFRLEDSKTGSRIIPYGDQVREALRKIPFNADLVFEGAKAGSPLSLRRPWYVVRQRADIDASATLHTLRHTFASWSVMGGLSLAQVGALLGHKSTQTTLRYADHALDALRLYGQQTSDALAALQTKNDPSQQSN